jgi:hypothetical protein
MGIMSNQSTGNLTASQAYTLTCSGAGGSTSASITVNVGAAPPPPQPVQITLTVTKDASSPTTNVVAGNSNQILAKFDIKATGGNVTFNEMDFDISGGNAVNNFRVIDDQGAQIGKTVNVTANSATVAEGSGSLNYIVPANTTRVLTVYGDLLSTALGTVQVSFTDGNNTSALGTFSTVWNMPANVLTVLPTVANLTVSASGYPISVVAGASNVEIGSYTLTAGQVNPLNLTGISIGIAAGAAPYLTNLEVMDGTTQLGNTYPTVTSNNLYTFNGNAPIAIPVNGSLTLNVYANISSSTPSATIANATTLTGVNDSTQGGQTVSIPSPISGQSVSFTTQ